MPTTFELRAAQDSDLPSIAQLFYDTIRNVNLSDYTPRQVAAWAPEVWTAQSWRERLAGQDVRVAVERDLVVGFVSIERSGHLDFLFVHKDHQRRGIGSALVGTVLEQARAWGLDRVFTESSITARGLFERFGFVVQKGEDIVRQGVTLHRYRMQCELTGPPK